MEEHVARIVVGYHEAVAATAVEPLDLRGLEGAAFDGPEAARHGRARRRLSRGRVDLEDRSRLQPFGASHGEAGDGRPLVRLLVPGRAHAGDVDHHVAAVVVVRLDEAVPLLHVEPFHPAADAHRAFRITCHRRVGPIHEVRCSPEPT